MKVRMLKPLAITLLLSGIIAMPAMAATSSNETEASQQPHKKSLEATVARLEKEVAALKNQKMYARKSNQSGAASVSPAPASDAGPYNQLSGKDLRRVINQDQTYLPFDLDVPGRAFVSTGPYVGVQYQFAGTDLIVQSPSVNTDVQLLNIRKSIITQLNSLGTPPSHSHVLLSGIIEAQAGYIDPNGGPSRTDIDVTNVSLDTTIFGPSDWLLGFVELSYDNSSPLDNGIFTSSSNFRAGNSRVYVNKAFITIGDFACSPFYGTIGQYYVPFGTYSSVMISDPLTKLLARTKARALELGFQQQTPNAFYGAVYIFRGDSHAHSVPKVSNGGINLGFRFDAGFFKGDVGGGVIANLTDSVGMQLGANFQNAEQLVHRVPAYNARGSFQLGTHINLIGEFVTASTQYNPNNMSFNNHGAKPWAFDTEATYSFCILDDKPSSIGIGYAKTKEALALGIPLTRTSLVLNTSLLRNTLQSLEFRHDRRYARSDVATAEGLSGPVSETRKYDNAVTAQFDYYF